MRLGVFGGLGKLGKAVVEASASYPEIEQVVIKDTADDVSLDHFIASCDVCVDTSSAEGTRYLCETLSEFAPSRQLKPLVVASTGHSVPLETCLSALIRRIPVMYMPNAALSVWHVLRAAVHLANHLGQDWDVHIEDYHHKAKQDCPSGTVVAFVAGLETACPWLKDRISVSSIRGGKGMIENSIIFSGDHQSIRISHQALSRSVFAKGLIEAALWIGMQQPDYYTIDDYLQASVS